MSVIHTDNYSLGAGLGSLSNLTADYIFDGYHLFPGAVLTLNDKGEVLAFNSNPAREQIEGAKRFKGIIAPGFINAHCHLELSHLKGVIEKGTGLPGFAGKVMQLRRFDKPVIAHAMAVADEAMWEAGIQAVGDICNTTDSLEQKHNSKIRYRNFIECLGFLPSQAEARFEYAREVRAAFYEQNKANTLVPHAPYSVSKLLFEKIADALMALNPPERRIISLHNQESLAENEFFTSKTGEFIRFYQKLGADISFFNPSGSSSLQTVLPYLGIRDSYILLVHNTFTGKEDIAAIAKQAKAFNQSFCFVLCPGANLYIEERLPDIPLLLSSGVPIALGTDSLASNDQLSIAAELEHIMTAFPEISKESLLKWATLNGARALGFDENLGSFEPGKRPGVILLDEQLHFIRRLC